MSTLQCFVCHQSDEPINLISPCQCTNIHAHRSCFEKHIRNSYTAQIMHARNGETFNCTICPQCNSKICIKLKTCSWWRWIQNIATKWQYNLIKNMFVSAFGLLYHSVGVVILLELFLRQIKKMEDKIQLKFKVNVGGKDISLKKIIWFITWCCRVLFLLIFTTTNFMNMSQYTTKLKLSIMTQIKMFKIKLEIELDPP